MDKIEARRRCSMKEDLGRDSVIFMMEGTTLRRRGSRFWSRRKRDLMVMTWRDTLHLHDMYIDIACMDIHSMATSYLLVCTYQARQPLRCKNPMYQVSSTSLASKEDGAAAPDCLNRDPLKPFIWRFKFLICPSLEQLGRTLNRDLGARGHWLWL